MKRCEYCNSMNTDDAVVCKFCGASSFVNRCDNCGTEFRGQRTCPNCGVTVGQKAKTCPRCKATYYTLACPTCGYTPDWKAPEEYSSQAAYSAPARRHTALWVLGWIFCFPIPLTVLIIRAKRLPVWAKVLLLVLLWGYTLGTAVSRS